MSSTGKLTKLGVGPLWIGALCVVISLIFTAHLTLAAEDSAAEDKPATTDAEKAPDAAGKSSLKKMRPALSLNSGELAVLKQLASRRRQIDEREARLVERERVAMAMEARLTEQAAELRRLQAALQKQAALIDEANKQNEAGDVERVKRLAKAYKAMKPKDAARLFEAMHISMLAPIAREISPRVLAPVLARLSVKKANALTIALREK